MRIRFLPLLLVLSCFAAQEVFAIQDAVSMRDNRILLGTVVSLDSAVQTIFFEEEIPGQKAEVRALKATDILMLRINGKVYPDHLLPWSYSREASAALASLGADTSSAFLWRYIAVLDLQGSNVPPQELAALSERIRDELKERNAFYVVNREEMNGLLRQSSLYGLDCSDTSCGREIAKVLRVPYVILGQVSSRNNLYTFELLLMNTRNGTISSAVVMDCLPCNQENVIVSTIRQLAIQIADEAAQTLSSDEKPARPAAAVAASDDLPKKKIRHTGLTGTLSVLALGLLFAATAYLFIAL